LCVRQAERNRRRSDGLFEAIEELAGRVRARESAGLSANRELETIAELSAMLNEVEP